MLNKLIPGIGILALVAVMILSPAQAVAQERQPIVYAVLFYSPQCPHCHEVITNDWPKLQEEFGDQFQLLFIDVTTTQGQMLYGATVEAFGVPPERQGVPTMILGTEVLVGSIEIPQRAPTLIREGLKAGGIGLPEIPGLSDLVNLCGNNICDLDESNETCPSDCSLEPIGPDMVTDRLVYDPFGNALAIGVLLGLVASAGAVTVVSVPVLSTRRKRPSTWLTGRAGWLATLITALVGLVVAITLIIQAEGNALSLLCAVGIAISLLIIVLSVGFRGAPEAPNAPFALSLPGWLIPLAAFAGLLSAIYLASVEIGQTEAICGAVGDCNTVQQSSYAHLFGVLPIGLFGVVGYIAIFLAWIINQFKDSVLSDIGHLALFAMALLGTLFSIYLTFLEPFVIGATCAWCLTSAIVMVLLLWLSAEPGLRVVRSLVR